MSYNLLPSLDQQLRSAREEAGQEFLWAHIDTCLSCYLNDHHNRDGELLLGVYVDGTSTIGQVLASLVYEFGSVGYQIAEYRAGYDHDKAMAALAYLINENRDRSETLFDSSLEYHSDDEFDGDYVQAWFLLTWDIPEEEDD